MHVFFSSLFSKHIDHIVHFYPFVSFTPIISPWNSVPLNTLRSRGSVLRAFRKFITSAMFWWFCDADICFISSMGANILYDIAFSWCLVMLLLLSYFVVYIFPVSPLTFFMETFVEVFIEYRNVYHNLTWLFGFQSPSTYHSRLLTRCLPILPASPPQNLARRDTPLCNSSWGEALPLHHISMVGINLYAAQTTNHIGCFFPWRNKFSLGSLSQENDINDIKALLKKVNNWK